MYVTSYRMRPLPSPPHSSNPFMMSSSLYVMSNCDVLRHSDIVYDISHAYCKEKGSLKSRYVAIVLLMICI